MASLSRLFLAVATCATLESALGAPPLALISAPVGLGAPNKGLSHAKRQHVPTRGVIEMKRKGKVAGGGPARGGPPSAMVEQQRQYAEYQKQRENSGLPSFDLYVKGPNSPTWYPAGSLGGDEQSKNLIESYMTDWTSGFAKDGINRGVANSLFPEREKFVAQCLATYPQLKKSKDTLKFGFKVKYPGLLEKRPEAKDITELNEEMQKNAFDKIKDNLFGQDILSGFEASRASFGDYDKFVTPPLNHKKYGGAPEVVATKEKGTFAQKLLANDDTGSVGMSIIGGSLLTLAAMLGVLVRRALQPAASSGHVLELQAQEPMIRVEEGVLQNSGVVSRSDNFRSRGWLQPSSTNSQPLTPCYALEYGTKAEMGAQPRVGEASLSFEMPAGVSGPFGLFDPLGFAEDALNLPPKMDRVRFYRECELKHGRVAMLAVLGFPVAEQFHPLFGGNIDVPSYIAFQQTPLQTFWPLVLLVIGKLEISSVFAFEQPLEESKWWTLKQDRMPGDFGFDPLKVYPSMFPAQRMEMRTKELNNGRLAMIAITGMVAQELATGAKLF